jgi:NNP family nitrate/nitrite transporter-like MFS transporter
VPKFKAAVKLPVTWEMPFRYPVIFGGFVAFSNYLPTYIKTI